MKINISIIIPCYNEVDNVEMVFENIKNNMPKNVEDYEIIFVNDGSNDGTRERLEELQRTNAHIKSIHLRSNSGYGKAVRAGLESARFNYVFYIDGDGQFDFSDAQRMLHLMLYEDLELVSSYRPKRKDLFYRLILGALGEIFCRLCFGIIYRDINCGFKLFKKEAIKRLNLNSHSALLFGLEIYLKAKRLNLNIAQIPVRHLDRKFGYSKGINKRQFFLAFGEILNKKYRQNLWL